VRNGSNEYYRPYAPASDVRVIKDEKSFCIIHCKRNVIYNWENNAFLGQLIKRVACISYRSLRNNKSTMGEKLKIVD